MADKLDSLLFGGQSVGQQPAQQGNYDKLDSILFGGNQEQPQNELVIPDKSVERQKSAVNFIDRGILGFGDATGNEKYLKEKFNIVQKIPGADNKFMVGQTVDSLQPVDPDGIQGDWLGELADKVGMLPEIIGQLTGGAIGTVGATPGVGTIAGGALGAGAGQAAKIGIGKALGVRDSSPMKEAVNVLASTTFGAAGEGVALGLGKLGKLAMTKAAGKLIDDAAKGVLEGSEQASKALKAQAKVFSVTAKIPEEKILQGGLYKFNKVLDKNTYMKPEYLNNKIMPDFVEGMVKRHKDLGEAVGAGKDWAIRNFGNKSLDIQPISGKLIQELSDPSIGIIKSSGKLNVGEFVDKAHAKIFNNIKGFYFKTNKRTGQIIPKNLKMKDYLHYKDRTKAMLRLYNDSKAANTNVGRIFDKYFAAVDDVAKKVTVPEGMTIQQVAQTNPFIKGNSEYSKWMGDIELLRNNGLSIKSINALDDAVRDKTVISSKMESFMKNLLNGNKSSLDAFKIVADQLPIKYPGGGIGGQLGSLSDEIIKFDVAQSFSNAKIDLLRFGMVSSILGRFGVLQGQIPGPVEIGLAALIGSPKGAGFTLKTLEKMTGSTSKMIRGAGKAADKSISGLGNGRVAALTLSKAARDIRDNNKK